MSTIITSEARCRDCYKCIRHCPVKAIGLKNGQAWVVEDKCILCGQCIKACPQKAKSTLSQIDRFDEMLQNGEEVIVSLAPSYLATSLLSSPWKMVAGLKFLGVAKVEETAVAAVWIGKKYAQSLTRAAGRPTITSCCPVIVNLIEKYYPQLIDCLPGLVSPMVAHARQIKAELGPHVKVVFIGPCYGKKAEALQDGSDVDVVLTFEELIDYFFRRELDLYQLGECLPDRIASEARFFPVPQGIIKTAGISQELSTETVSVSGIDECIELLDDLAHDLIHPRFIEALACKGGCTGGPAIGTGSGVAARREQLLKYAFGKPNPDSIPTVQPWIDLTRQHMSRCEVSKLPTEKELQEILALTGKNTLDDETNCGGCGYSSCREKAIAVFQGLAEPEMCIPFMKNKAESFSNAIVDTTLNAIIVVDQQLTIQKSNPAALRMFGIPCHDGKGDPLHRYLDVSDFQKVLETQKVLVSQKNYAGIPTRQIIYPLPKYGVVIGIFSDMTQEEARKAKFDKMKREAFERASKVIHEQMRTAQEIAGLLGESTSETKATLLELMQLMESEPENGA